MKKHLAQVIKELTILQSSSHNLSGNWLVVFQEAPFRHLKLTMCCCEISVLHGAPNPFMYLFIYSLQNYLLNVETTPAHPLS